ncbi:DUF5916 domain-containing protein [Marilutibacter chinensis]|uniref:DUF5916 domain-containing protein n=1 Tax=Marilutibacter chinensis TaxID=2912247 RepID=A0ABS9HW95_9GAMM|nr:DUF5916 domain-containing protein [Lysobacter chinensis]MCF7222425.1 DUF5916 domain-containing protein [Lysobacter chinensis]
MVYSLALFATPVAAVEIDGRIDPDEWRDARHVTGFRKVQPLSLEPGSLPTEAWVMATPEGLAIAFRNTQPQSVTWTRQKVQRDFSAQVDRVNLMVDFDGDGRTGYNFTVASTGGVADAVITNESQFNDDWDGHWQHAVTEDGEGWSVEMLIPWYIAPMRSGENGMRTIGIQLDRVIGSTGERMAWPGASFERPRYLSEFEPVEVVQYSQALLAVTPYVSGLYDNISGDSDFEGGLDLFWKPNGQFQLTAAVNPDFGQVESDDLVINFSATETFISDKRPFFTENQGIFEFTTPSDDSQLLYTRRIGGPADDRRGAGDIDAAVKLNGSLGATKYGVFLAEEAGEVGRTFGALRLVRDFESQNLGAMLTRVERPFLDREATVLGVDHNWRPTPRWNVRTRVFGSQVEQHGEDVRDMGATVWADYEMDGGWRQQWIAMHFGNDLEINDAGFLARNSTNYLHWEVRRRFDALAEGSRYASKDWRGRISTNHNNRGEKLNDQFRLSRQGNLRNGSYEYGQINVNSPGISDLLLRGHGIVKLPASFNAFYEYERPRKGDWAHDVELELFGGGLAGNSKLGSSVWYGTTYFISDAFSINAGVVVIHRPDWLIWQGHDHGDLVGAFDGRESKLKAGLDWTISDRQELRVKLQAIGIDARAHGAWRFDAAGNAVASMDAVDDFSVRNLGFQIRYRYELAPLSYLYVVYGRGGLDSLDHAEGVGDALFDSFDLRDDEQLLVKLSYRFEI